MNTKDKHPMSKEDGAISADSFMRLGLVLTILGAAIGGSIAVGKIITIQEGQSDQLRDIKTSLKDLVRIQGEQMIMIRENQYEIRTLKKNREGGDK